MQRRPVIRAHAQIRRTLKTAQRPAVMCSFGKDSLVLVDLLTRYGVRDVLYLENIDEVVDNEYITTIVERYGLRVHPLPRGRGVLFFVRGTAQFFCYPFVSATTMLSVPMALPPWTGAGAYLCVDDELRAVHGAVVPYDFDVLFFGNKHVDLRDGGGACLPWYPMLSAAAQDAYRHRMTPTTPRWRFQTLVGCSPLLDWTQDDVWAYIDDRHLPVSANVYDAHRQRRLHTTRACYRCHDPNLPATVLCPRVGAPITNLGAFLPPTLAPMVALGLMSEAEAEELHADCHS